MVAQFCKRLHISYTPTENRNRTWSTTHEKFIIYDMKDSNLYGVLKGKDVRYYNAAGDIVTNGRVTHEVYGYTKDSSAVIIQ